MRLLNTVFFFVLLTASLSAETQYTCHIKKVFDANSQRLYDAAGIPSIDTMLLTLQGDVLSHQLKGKAVKYLKQGSGITRTRNLQQSSFIDVSYTEYKTDESLPMIIYVLNGFKKIIRIDFDQTYTYDCVTSRP